ncbi:uncharacterized protein LOC135943080 isoform X1 [Cloeon dipterum]|uniref:uncharacterized protein LOC135943080 isoform X1 n=1 Tax=Cloeon dipterum TaxID=197152 RepID=UPI00321FD044
MVLLYIAIFMELLLLCTSYDQGGSKEMCPTDFMPKKCSKNLSCYCTSTRKLTNISCSGSKLNLFDSTTGGLICPRDDMNDCDCSGMNCLLDIRRNRFQNINLSLQIYKYTVQNNKRGNLQNCPTGFFKCHPCGSSKICFCESLKLKLKIICWNNRFQNLYSADTGNPICPDDPNKPLFGCDESICGTSQITTTTQNMLSSRSQPRSTSMNTNNEVTNVPPTVAGMAPTSKENGTLNNHSSIKNTVVSSTTAPWELKPKVTEKSQDATNPTNSAYFALILLIIPIIVIIWIVWKKFTASKNSEKPGGETFVMEENDVYGTVPGLNRSDAYSEENELYGHVRSAGPRCGNDDVENELYGTLG